MTGTLADDFRDIAQTLARSGIAAAGNERAWDAGVRALAALTGEADEGEPYTDRRVRAALRAAQTILDIDYPHAGALIGDTFPGQASPVDIRAAYQIATATAYDLCHDPSYAALARVMGCDRSTARYRVERGTLIRATTLSPNPLQAMNQRVVAAVRAALR